MTEQLRIRIGRLEQELAEANAELERLRDALRVIRGPEDRGPWIDVYRRCGGGYAGLQAIAIEALDEGMA